MEHGTIASWSKKEGDSFGAGDVLCEVETDKATVAFESVDEGIVAKILVEAGSAEIKVGEPILVTVEDAGSISAFKDFKPDGGPPKPAGKASSPPSSPPPAPEKSSPSSSAPASDAPPPPTPATPSTSPPSSPTPPPSSPRSDGGGRIFASPLAKRLASEKGFDLRSMNGTGPNGRIIAADVREFKPSLESKATPTHTKPEAATIPPASGLPATPPPATEPPRPGTGYIDFPTSETSRAIAARLTQAKQTVPHYYLTVDLMLSKLLELRENLNKGLEKDEKLSVNDFLLKAAAVACKKVPEANASWHGEFVRQYAAVDINLIVGVGDGLLAPVIREVDTKGIKAISGRVREFVGKAEAGEGLSNEVLQTGTFTVVNVGSYGVKSIAPIVNLPQSCALGFGAIENRVVPKEGEVKEGEEVYDVVPGVTVTLSCDHRVIDGAVGAQWLSAYKLLVEDPTTLLL